MAGRFEVALLVEDVVERQEHLLLRKGDPTTQLSSAATFRTCLPMTDLSGITVPQRIAGRPWLGGPCGDLVPGPQLALSRKSFFSSKSAGGYPQTASSGNMTRFRALRRTPAPRYSMIF